MNVDVDKIWANNELAFAPTKVSEIISTLYFSKFEDSSEIEEQMEDWSLEDLFDTYEVVSQMYTYDDGGEMVETEFAEPEFELLLHEFYNAANISSADSYFIKSKSKKMFF